MSREHAFAFGLLLILGKHVAAIDATRDPALNAELSSAATQLDRLALIPNDDDWKFDFTAQAPFYNWAPGGVTNMNSATFPAAAQNGLTCKYWSTTSKKSNTNACSGYGQSWSLLYVATTFPPSSRELGRICHGHDDYIHVRREWCAYHQNGASTWRGDNISQRKYSLDDE